MYAVLFGSGCIQQRLAFSAFCFIRQFIYVVDIFIVNVIVILGISVTLFINRNDMHLFIELCFECKHVFLYILVDIILVVLK